LIENYAPFDDNWVTNRALVIVVILLQGGANELGQLDPQDNHFLDSYAVQRQPRRCCSACQRRKDDPRQEGDAVPEMAKEQE
jgi:hypothetical protein